MSRFQISQLCTAAILSLLASCRSTSGPASSGDAFFISEAKPILERNCLQCHSGQGAMSSKLNLTSKEAALAVIGGKRFIVPGEPDHSLLITAISRKGGHPTVMPRLDMSLTADQIAVLREWIEDGAAWPAGKAGQLTAKPNPER